MVHSARTSLLHDRTGSPISAIGGVRLDQLAA
jgi:hypothetical protein